MDSIDHLDLDELNEKSSYWSPSWQIWAQFEKLLTYLLKLCGRHIWDYWGLIFSHKKHLRNYDQKCLRIHLAYLRTVSGIVKIFLNLYRRCMGDYWGIFSGEISEKQWWETLIFISILANKSTVWDNTENSEMWVYWGLCSQKTSLRNRRLTNFF